MGRPVRMSEIVSALRWTVTYRAGLLLGRVDERARGIRILMRTHSVALCMALVPVQIASCLVR
jgi:hypothetical protein